MFPDKVTSGGTAWTSDVWKREETGEPPAATPQNNQLPPRQKSSTQRSRSDPLVAGVGQPPSSRIPEKRLLKDLRNELVVWEPSYFETGKLPVIYTRIFDAEEQQAWESCACWKSQRPEVQLKMPQGGKQTTSSRHRTRMNHNQSLPGLDDVEEPALNSGPQFCHVLAPRRIDPQIEGLRNKFETYPCHSLGTTQFDLLAISRSQCFAEVVDVERTGEYEEIPIESWCSLFVDMPAGSQKGWGEAHDRIPIVRSSTRVSA